MICAEILGINTTYDEAVHRNNLVLLHWGNPMNQYEKFVKIWARELKRHLWISPTRPRTLDSALLAIADAVEAQTDDEIMAANELDLENLLIIIYLELW